MDIVGSSTIKLYFYIYINECYISILLHLHIIEAIFQPSPFITSEVILDKKDLNQEAMIAKQNQAVVIASLDICLQQLSNPPEPWSTHITRYYKENLHR